MLDKRIENLNVYSEDVIETPEAVKEKYPLSERATNTIMSGQATIKNILAGTDHRLFVVVGPCSIHDVKAAREYARKLMALSKEVADTLVLVMRVYFEKPRTRVGWQGLINDPYLDNSCRIGEGVHMARELLLYLAELGLPAAGEALDIVTPQYVQDLISWTAIGARTTESQSHRKMVSGFSSAVGFKNGTSGDLNVAINAMHQASNAHNFVSVNPAGHVAVIRTKGNSSTHIVLRGGNGKPNYDAKNIARCEMRLREAGLTENIMVDCSHANSSSEPEKQIQVIEDVCEQMVQGNCSVMSLMIESNLNWGRQPIPSDLSSLRYGVSVTDACIDWNATERALRAMQAKLRDVLPKRTCT